MCSKSQLGEILEKVSETAKEIFNEKLDSVILFGSYARGDYDEESDIDIMLIVDLSPEKLREYRCQLEALSGTLLYDYGILVSIIEKDAETYRRYANILPFYKNIEKEGIKIA